ncbi:ComEC/Rec2 family competence protein [Paenibacillus physcomitrellae]|uniref:ComEC/Rec2 family competence protein n=1 Tax=Paenibacillus physcomitrellae TaxID=1619311 RepID=UPI000B8CCC3D|nr:ComEC/Rec2 family competence protein [Paenibacillus physcomitrellae]
MKQRPLLESACWWIAGSGIAYFFSGGTRWLLWAACLLGYSIFALRMGRAKKQTVVMLLLFTASFLYWQIHEAHNHSTLPDRLQVSEEELNESQVRLKGILVSAVERDGDRADFIMEVNQAIYGAAAAAAATDFGGTTIHHEKVQVQVRLAKESEIQIVNTWTRGQSIEIEGTLEQPAGARNFGGFDYSAYLHNKHIHWLLKAPGAAAVKTGPGPFSIAKLLGYNDQMRQAVGRQIEFIFGGNNAGFMKGLLIGDTEELDPDIYSGFSALGLTHILAISGSHVAVNVAVLFWLLRRFRVPRETSITAVIAFIPFYMLLTGLSPSVVRSGIMAMIGLFLLRKHRLKDGLHVLAAAALLMLVWEPYYLLDVSFQLSFVVTAGLIVVVPLMQPFFSFLPKRLAGAVAITLTAQLASFPLTIYYFNQFSLLSLLSNLLLVPAISLVSLPAGTAALVLSYIYEPFGKWAAYPIKAINAVTFDAVAWLEAREGVMLIWKSPPLWWIALFYVLLYLMLKWIRRASVSSEQAELWASRNDDTVPLHPDMAPGQRSHSAVLGWAAPSALTMDAVMGFLRSANKRYVYGAWLCGVLLAAVLYGGYQPAYAKGRGYVQFIDVGQGDCMLITTPQGRNILVDSGGTVSFRKASDAWRDRRVPYEVGAKVVVPILKKRGIHALDAVIITHWDQDHAGGLQAVLDQIPVKALVMNGSVTDTPAFKKVFSRVEQRKIPVYYAHNGLRLQADRHTQLQFIGPLEEEQGQSQSRTEEIRKLEDQNARSVVFLMEMEGVSFLFTGDMDAKEERVVMLDLQQAQGLTGGKTIQGTGGPGAVDVLKVAHHGSKTSTTEEWLNYWKPRHAVISVGANNTYGHPNGDVLQRLLAAGTEVQRTDELGEIQISVKDGKMTSRHKVEK